MSEDNNINPQNEETVETPNTESAESWESQLRSRANDLFSRRTAPLKAEIERLQATINDISSRFQEQTQAEPSEEETSGLLDHVRQWFSDSSSKAEADFQARLVQARLEAADEVRERAQQEFESSLISARAEWEAEFLKSNEESFQKRLEQASDDAAAISRRESETRIEEMREQLEASRKALTLAVASSQSAGFDTLRESVDEIDAQRTQSETLSSLVKLASQFAPRVVFFVVRGGDAVGWKASGFENGLNDDTVKLLSLPAQNPSLLHDALTSFKTAVGKSASPGDNSAILGLYGSPAPERSAAFPLVVRGKAAAVLYADSGTQSETSINTPAIETLLRVASMAIELLPARRGLEPPSRPVEAPAAPVTAPTPVTVTEAPPEEVKAEVQQVESVPTAEAQEHVRTTADIEEPGEPGQPDDSAAQEQQLQEAEAQIESHDHAEPEPEPVPETEVEQDRYQDEESAIEAEIEAEMVEAEVEIEADADTAEMPIPVIPPPPTPPPFAFDKPAISEMVNEAASAPTIPIKPRTTLDLPKDSESEVPEAQPAPVEQQFSFAAAPPPVVQQTVPTPASETEQRSHNDARRFARLLVSEIKLYNAAKVNDGRRNFDLYDRLRDEIDRSRKVYDKRVSPAVASRFDYFYDELVQTLAEGDPAKLGDGCPGPVVITT
ncbi:MAG: hypothetical protein IPO77_02010 [Acidobacteria bacterium]|nr:hypothetical protein [Acidobacteriota bacterium]